MENIPVSFECEGKNYTGTMCGVCGAGTQVYHLMIEKFYNGKLRLTERYGWVFDPTPKTEHFSNLTNYFSDVVIAWYE